MVSKSTTKRWNEFQKQKAVSFLSHKGNILIIIYGAYNPPGDGEHLGEKERLIKLQDRLKKDGYTETYIVEDIPYNEKSFSPNLDKSYYCLEFADLKNFYAEISISKESIEMKFTISVVVRNHKTEKFATSHSMNDVNIPFAQIAMAESF